MSSICNTVGIGPTQYARSIFSEYAQVDNPLISEYISSIPGRLSDAVKRIGDQLIVTKGENILSNRRKLSRHISAFHSQAGTDLPGVKRCLGNLCNPSTQILISIHQPNLFAYSGVFKKIVLLQTIKSLLEKQNDSLKDSFVNLFVIVDHDFMDDIWIRAAQLPSIRHTSGNLELRMPVPGANRWKLACNMPVPNCDRRSLEKAGRLLDTKWLFFFRYWQKRKTRTTWELGRILDGGGRIIQSG